MLVGILTRPSEDIVVEGPWMMYRDSTYYLFYSSGWVQTSNYKMEVARSTSIMGKFVKGDVPVIQACFLTSAANRSIGFTITEKAPY